ncbi:MAG: 3-phosphoshikimate 1-carboxyvinyltransferase [Clostridium sp.]|nr:3-phosphoshikimate 1-carboxyvinyltransferase [Clostridium sp.]
MIVRIFPPEEIIDAAIELPLSKSMSNRALIINALSPGALPLENVAICDDTKAVMHALQADAFAGNEINVGPAGTAMRFLTAYFACLLGSHVVLDGNERMRERPIGPLVDALRQCGADIEYEGEEGFPPLRIKGRKLHGGDVEMPGAISSQFASALLLVAPTFSSPLRLTLKGEIASLPYIDMSLGMMRRASAQAERYGNIIDVQPIGYMPAQAPIERDWSAASYWYQIAAMSGGWVTLKGMSLDSLQGDRGIAKIFEQLGVFTEPSEDSPNDVCLNPSPEVYSRVNMNLADMPDLAQTLVVACCMMGLPFRIEGLETLRIKETDRLQALKDELAKLSFKIGLPAPGVIEWDGARIPVREVPPIDAYGDHRMAMAFAPVSIFLAGLIIEGAETVAKSYPEYWDHLRQAGFMVEEYESLDDIPPIVQEEGAE